MKWIAPLLLVPLLVPILATPPALADVKGQNGKTIDCYCTDRTGSRIELGEYICLQVDGNTFTAQCQMSLNVPMWRKTQDGCLSSSLGGTLRDRVRGSGPQQSQPPVNSGGVHS